MRVQLAGVAKNYGAQVVLDQVSLTIGPRARIGLVGPNGVGKSTLLRIVAGAEAPDGGRRLACARALTVGYLEQERAACVGRVGSRGARADERACCAAERELEDAAAALARGAPGGRPLLGGARALPRARRRRLPAAGAERLRRARARRRPRPRTARRSPAARPPASRSPRSSSPASTSSCSTSRRTTSTSTGSSGSRAFLDGVPRRARCSSPTTASSSTGSSTGSWRSTRDRIAPASGPAAGATTRPRVTSSVRPRSPSTSRRSAAEASSRSC